MQKVKQKKRANISKVTHFNIKQYYKKEKQVTDFLKIFTYCPLEFQLWFPWFWFLDQEGEVLVQMKSTQEHQAGLLICVSIKKGKMIWMLSMESLLVVKFLKSKIFSVGPKWFQVLIICLVCTSLCCRKLIIIYMSCIPFNETNLFVATTPKLWHLLHESDNMVDELLLFAQHVPPNCALPPTLEQRRKQLLQQP